jgi:hypothetical protein
MVGGVSFCMALARQVRHAAQGAVAPVWAWREIVY